MVDQVRDHRQKIEHRWESRSRFVVDVALGELVPARANDPVERVDSVESIGVGSHSCEGANSVVLEIGTDTDSSVNGLDFDRSARAVPTVGPQVQETRHPHDSPHILATPVPQSSERAAVSELGLSCVEQFDDLTLRLVSDLDRHRIA